MLQERSRLCVYLFISSAGLLVDAGAGLDLYANDRYELWGV
ncbi:hypothetical protein Brsp04_03331 [Brucella sp. NBRC 12952]|jgi:hypothetical protein|uniref:Uncharacterized protein n=1 Tax=Brucella pseudogrignonensis TaxID=419475 RepID=A0A256G6H5_9HYPH|nr:hypothetical protein CEV34_4382 [Brucella pseudogrignonensis]